MRIDRFERLERFELLEHVQYRLQSQDPLRVAVKDFLHQLIRVTQFIPLSEEAIERDARIVAAEHDLVLKPALDIPLQSVREILRRPAR